MSAKTSLTPALTHAKGQEVRPHGPPGAPQVSAQRRLPPGPGWAAGGGHHQAGAFRLRLQQSPKQHLLPRELLGISPTACPSLMTFFNDLRESLSVTY